MSLTATPNGDRVQIAIFGRRNAGKSSVMNAVTGRRACHRIRCEGNYDRSGLQGDGDTADRTVYVY